MNITCVRHAYLENVTLCRWYLEGGRRFMGLSEPWIPSKHGPGGARLDVDGKASCIPDGEYVLRPHVSARYPKDRYVWAFSNVALGVWPPGGRPAGQKWGRDACLWHPGTTVKDIEGCELAGMRHGEYEGLAAVFESQLAFRELRELLGMETHTVTIRPSRGTSEALWS